MYYIILSKSKYKNYTCNETMSIWLENAAQPEYVTASQTI